jgi:hypothetical protein
MTEEIFWNMIEKAWVAVAPDLHHRRMEIATDGVKSSNDLGEMFANIIEEDLIQNLVTQLSELTVLDVVLFDRILERKMYDIDRDDVHEYTDGGDDGFMYARGFIVGMGKAYYDLINKEPAYATMGLQAELFCYFPMCSFTQVNIIEDEITGEETYEQIDIEGFETANLDIPPSNISRETGSNTSGWQS